MQQTKKFPTLVGLFIVAVLVGAVIYFGEQLPEISSLFPGRRTTASHVEITNRTDTSFSISWITQSPVIGDVIVSGGELNRRVVLDDRDTPTKKTPSITHHVTVRNLVADTPYNITIRLGGVIVDSQLQQLTTAPTISPLDQNSLGPAYGSIITETSQPAEGSLVYVTLEGGQMLSTIVTPSGSWLIPLNRIRTSDGTAYLQTHERMSEEIVVRVIDEEDAHAITDTLNDSPVPVMALGKSYDFTKLQAQAIKPTTVLGSSTSTKQEVVSLVAPEDGAAIPSAFPLIHGTGIAGKTVVLTLGITNPYSDTITVGTDSLWRYTPPKPLGIGKQSVTMTTEDAMGKTVAITHLFEILKSGTQVLGEATPSATLTLTPSPTSTLAGEPIPTSGSMLPTLVSLIFGIGLVVSGALMLGH